MTSPSIRSIVETDNECNFTIKTNSLANAVRRSLMNDVENHAATSIFIRKNTSCQTDEYIAHRIGMIPFSKVEDKTDEIMTIKVSDRSVWTRDMVGTGFKALYDIPILKMKKDQELDLDIRFGTGRGRDHAKFSHISTVSFKECKNGVCMGFETNNTDEPPLNYLKRSLEELIKMVDAATYFIESEYDSTRVVL